MTRYLTILAFATMAACSGGEDPASTTDTPGDDDDDATGCSNAVLAQYPENGAEDIGYRTKVSATFLTADATATITVADSTGADVPGSSMVNDKTVTWIPSAPLMANSDYTTTITYECGAESSAWKTDGTGTPTTADLVDMTYSLDISSGYWVKPAGVGDIIGSLAGEAEVLFGIVADNGNSLDMIGALGDGSGNQDVCAPSIEFPVPPTYDNPYFELVSDSLDLSAAGYTFTIEDLALSGAFSEDGSQIRGAALEGSIDTRPLVDLLAPGGGEDSVCLLVSTFGVPCEPCADGSGDFCLSMDVIGITADAVPTVIEVITDADVEANADCITTSGS